MCFCVPPHNPHTLYFLQSVEGMKVICHELTQVAGDPENSAIEDLSKDADRLVSCLATMVIEFVLLSHAIVLLSICLST